MSVKTNSNIQLNFNHCTVMKIFLILQTGLSFFKNKTSCLRMHGVYQPKQFKRRTVKYLSFVSSKKKHDFFYLRKECNRGKTNMTFSKAPFFSSLPC